MTSEIFHILHNKTGKGLVMILIYLKDNSRTSNNKTNNTRPCYGMISDKLASKYDYVISD